MAQTVKVAVFKDVQLSTLIDKDYPEKTSTVDIVYQDGGLNIFRACNFRNLRNTLYFFEVLFVAQHDEHEEFIVASAKLPSTRIENTKLLEREVKIELIRKIKAAWSLDLMKKSA